MINFTTWLKSPYNTTASVSIHCVQGGAFSDVEKLLIYMTALYILVLTDLS